MDTEVKDPKELTVFAAFMTPMPNEEPLSTGDSGAPKRRRSVEDVEETGTGSSSSEPGIYLTNPSALARPPKTKGKGKGKGGGKNKGRQQQSVLRIGDTAGSRAVGSIRETFLISSPGWSSDTSFSCRMCRAIRKSICTSETGPTPFLPSLFLDW